MKNIKIILFSIFSLLIIISFAFGASMDIPKAFQIPAWDWLRRLFVVPTTTPTTTVSTVPLYKPLIEYENAVTNAVEQAVSGTVSVVITKNLPVVEECLVEPFGLPFEFREFFGMPFNFSQPCTTGKTERRQVGGGSGFVVDESGLIVTNKHVIVDQRAAYTVVDSAGIRYRASVVALDPVLDIGFLRIEGATNLKPLALGDSDSLRLGQTLIAVGNALGEFRNTVSVGVVSGLARRVTASGPGSSSEVLQGVIQTDAAINRGNSGGPLVNLRGEVVGINVAVAQGSENIGFAIPINQVKRSIQSVKQGGKITGVYLGVRYLMLSPEIVEREGLSVSYGALIRGTVDGPAVIPKSPAARAGLIAEDIIQAINGIRIDENNPLVAVLQRFAPRDTVTLTIFRDGKVISITAVLEERPQ